jgi:hypothetical protein
MEKDYTTNEIARLIESLRDELRVIGWQVGDVERKVSNLDRRVSAIRSFPVPWGRPKAFHSITETHVIGNPIRRRIGHYG